MGGGVWRRASVQDSPFLASLGRAGLASPDSRVCKWSGEKKALEPRQTRLSYVGALFRERDVRNRYLVFMCERKKKRQKKRGKKGGHPTLPAM